jgi:hypothetical protein
MAEPNTTVDTGAAAAAAAAAAATAAAAAPNWLTAAGDAELTAYAANRGWDKLPAEKVAVEATRAHREASRLIGVPETQLLRLPTAPDAPEWKGVYERLGAPKAATEYKFDTVKFKDGTALDPKFVTDLQALAYKNHLSVDAAVDMAKGFVQLADQAEDVDNTATTQKIALEKTELLKNWGPNEAVNKIIAARAAEKLGLDVAHVNALENLVGYKTTMETLLILGQQMGEDNFVRVNNGNQGSTVLTADQATEKIRSLKADPEWRKKYLDGGTASNEYRELNGLIAMGGKNTNG